MNVVTASRTFEFRFQRLKVGLVDTDQALFPFSSPRHHLADLLGFLLVSKGTYPIPRDNVFEYS